ncbi:hypothetical protein NDU88_003725 [Pleurodeles waltl]|uniref:Uncharacterized protein n=1 Tax=Pleurodeles waltl TaxID=8319 RepID=A0AAV7SGT1_PLEWA|nr:hypothetical protein NDU88_003725 [Pleurodeles waltl]
MVGGTVHFCQDLEEAWTLLEQYTFGTFGSQREEAVTAQCRKRRRKSRNHAGQSRLAKPMPTQSEEGKQLEIRAAASLTEAEVSDAEGERKDQDHDSPVRL